MTTLRKDNPAKDKKEPGVIASARVTSARAFSRRDFLKWTTSTLAIAAVAPILSGCGSPEEQTPTPTSPPPTGTINNDNTPLLAYPGDVTNVILTLAAGTVVELVLRDSSSSWVKVRITEGENVQKEGWIKKDEFTFLSSVSLSSIPKNNDVHPLGTPESEVKVEEKVEGKVKYSQIIYTTPGDTSSSGFVTQDDTIEILERDSTDSWFKVKTSSGEVGWIQQSEVQANKGYEAKVTINRSVVPVVIPPSNPSNNGSGGSGGTWVTYYYPN